jgi:hypothetical protein
MCLEQKEGQDWSKGYLRKACYGSGEEEYDVRKSWNIGINQAEVNKLIVTN